MASPLSSDDDIFDRLKSAVDPDVVSEREKAVQQRVRAQYEKAQQRLKELIDENQTLPVRISDVRVHGIKNTRGGFLQGVFAEALSSEKQPEYTLKTALDELQRATDRLHRFGIFHPTINMYLDRSPGSTSEETVISADLSVSERGWLVFKSGTELGNAEGGGYLNAAIRNAFGGAESICASVSGSTSTTDVGRRSRSSYEASFTTPIAANPDTVADVGAFASSRSNHFFASHEEATRGVRAGLRFLGKYGEHEVRYAGIWRQVTRLSPDASMSVRNDAGDSVKSSITHTITRDSRNNKPIPTSGFLFKNIIEIAGFAGLGGDVAFVKSEAEFHRAGSLTQGVSFSTGLRAGLMCPLPLGFGVNQQPIRPSRINDRFFLGGATDIRGFRESGLGPRDGNDAVGGDVYVAGGASLFVPIPRLGTESPFRFQAFINGGRLVGMQGIDHDMGGDVKQSLFSAVREIGIGYPSIAAGVGLVYAHPIARVELNFALPIVKRAGEKGRKGLQLGVGINFL